MSKQLRECTVCKQQKPDDKFSHQKSKYKNTGKCKECKRNCDRKDYYKHREKRLAYWQEHKTKFPDRLREINRLAVSRHRFGLDRDEIIKDDTTCEHCGIAQSDHKELYGLSLNIHHIDGWGRKALRVGEKPNNDPSNLLVLCSRCHTIEHNTKRINREYKSETSKKAWDTRRKRYGKSGGNHAKAAV